MFTFLSSVEPIPAREMFGQIGQTYLLQRGYKAGVGVLRKGQRDHGADCLKNVKRCPSTTFMKKFNKKTGFLSPKNLSIMVRVRYSGTNMRIFAMNLCVCPYWPCK